MAVRPYYGGKDMNEPVLAAASHFNQTSVKVRSDEFESALAH